MIKIRTFIGRKLNHIDGILRRQVELDRWLKEREDVKLFYEYYEKPKNVIDFLSKRYFLYPIYNKKKVHEKNVVNHITFQYLGDLAHFLDKNKTIITCHDIFTFLEKKNPKNPLVIQKYSLAGLKKCKYVVSISEFTKNELITKLKVPEEKIIVIKNGINQKMFYPIPPNESFQIEPLYPTFKKILHVGTEIYRKDFLTLLKAFNLVKKGFQKVKLIRVGTPSYPHLIKKLGLEKDIIYLRNISNERLREIYNLSDIFVYPSLYEGWGAPGLEAASCGTPVICSDIPIFREIYKDFPIFFTTRDYEKLAEIIVKTLNNEVLRSNMKEKGLKIVREYDWKKSAEKYLQLIKNVNLNQ